MSCRLFGKYLMRSYQRPHESVFLSVTGPGPVSFAADFCTEVYLIDFGLAKRYCDSKGKHHQICGTAAW